MFCTRLASSVALLLTTTGISGTNHEAMRPRSMAFAGIGEINGDVFVIRGNIGPAGFFENMQSVDSKDGTVFRNNVGEVQFFPDRVTITLHVVGPFTKGARASGPDAQYMKGLKFKAEWKRGFELRPVKAFRQLSASVTESVRGDVPWDIKECWIYEFVIEDAEVPISDHLILNVMSPENKRLARLSAYL